MTREILKQIFADAKENKLDVFIAVTIPGQDSYEYIINKHKSLNEKMLKEKNSIIN